MQKRYSFVICTTLVIPFTFLKAGLTIDNPGFVKSFVVIPEIFSNTNIICASDIFNCSYNDEYVHKETESIILSLRNRRLKYTFKPKETLEIELSPEEEGTEESSSKKNKLSLHAAASEATTEFMCSAIGGMISQHPIIQPAVTQLIRYVSHFLIRLYSW